jgi:hypothetical protein
MSASDCAFAMAIFLLVAATTSIGCASQGAILTIRPGDDHQAKILVFDGVPFAVFAGRHGRVGQFHVPLRPGVHELRVVVPGPCTYLDGRPGPGSSVRTMDFVARAGGHYEVTLAFFPGQLFDEAEVHVYEEVKAPDQVQSVETTTSYEADPSSCPKRRGMTP